MNTSLVAKESLSLTVRNATTCFSIGLFTTVVNKKKSLHITLLVDSEDSSAPSNGPGKST